MTERAPLLLLIASLATLLAALGFQYLGGLDPCVLCIYQRWPYVAIALICTAALFARSITPPVLFASAAVFFIGAGLAAYHVGVEQGWVAGTAACGAPGGSTSGAATIEQLRAQVMNAPVTRCDEIAWSLFGISMAGYNLLISIALAAFSCVAGLRWHRQT